MAGLDDSEQNVQIQFDNGLDDIVNEIEIDNTTEKDEQADGVGVHTSESQDKLIKLPLTRIKSIIKTDPDVKLASQEAVITLAKAAVSFCLGITSSLRAFTLIFTLSIACGNRSLL